MKSIRSRLTAGLFLSLIGSFLLLWILIFFSIHQLAENYIASRLQHDIETLLTAVEFDDNNALLLKLERINPIYQRPYSGHYYVIKHEQQLLRSRSLWDQKLKVVSKPITEDTISKIIGPKQQHLLLISRKFTKQGHKFIIHVAEDLSDIYKRIEQLKRILILAAATVLVVLIIIQIFILKQGLKPLHSIKEEVVLLKKGKVKKINEPSVEELKPLSNEINHLLSILNQRLKRSRHALSDLSHAIKKPLTVLHQIIDDESNNRSDKTTQIVKTQLNTIQQITDRILKQARLAGTGHSSSLFDFKQDLSQLINTIRMMYPHKDINILTTLPDDIDKYYDREDILELLGNLLDNAYKWADKQILITLVKTEFLTFSIEDDGPGCDKQLLHQLAHRGTRLDEKTQGHGFGLAIAGDIVKEYHGTMKFSKSEKLHGFKVEIAIPV